jgi:hypothetical protein
LTTALLGVLTTAVALVAGAVAADMARGVFTLVQATAVTDRWGRPYYGHLTGLLSAPMTITITITIAFAPFAGAALAHLLGSYANTFLVLGVLPQLRPGCPSSQFPGTYRKRGNPLAPATVQPCPGSTPPNSVTTKGTQSSIQDSAMSAR